MVCKYCGQKAGLFRKVHKQCQLSHTLAKYSIIDKIKESIISSADFANLETDVKSEAQKGYITQDELENFYNIGFDKAVETFLDDGVISSDEENKISRFKGHFNLDQTILNKNGSFEKVAKGLILNDIFQGKLPDKRITLDGNSPFLLGKDETLIWIFQNVEFYEQRTRTTFEGRSQGVSIKIAKGVYYRTGQFKGNPVVSTQMTFIATGLLALTNKNFYFASNSKNFKTPYKKLISMTQYSDGIGLQKDGVSAKPQIFKDLDGWFAYNVISNLRND